MNPMFFRKAIIFILLAIVVLIGPIEASAIENEGEFDDFFDNYKSIMLIIDVESGNIVEANQAAADFYGYKQIELTSMKIQDINQLTTEETAAEMKAAFEEDRNYFLFNHKLASGEIRNVEVYSYPLQIDGRNQLYSIIPDVTDKPMLQKALDARNRNMAIWGAIFIIAQAGVIFLLWKSIRKNKRIQAELAKTKEQYKSLFDNMEEGFALHEIITDESGAPIDYRFINVNDAFKESTGLKDVEGKTIKELIPETESTWIRKYGSVALTGETIRFESFSEEIGKNYSIVAFSPAKNQFATVFFDITKRVKAERALAAEKERLRTTLLSVGDGVIVTDVDGCIEYINIAAEEITGRLHDDIKGKSFRDVFEIVDKRDGKTQKFPVDDVLDTRVAIDWTEHSCLVLQGENCIEITLSAAPIIGEKGVMEGVVLVFKDISDESRRRDEIEFMSYHDFLTNLYNRRFFEEELARLDTKRNLPLSIIYADVNGLKIVNDAFGHEYGDKLLTETAKILREFCRADDIIARVGGDEFAILLPSTSSEMAKSLVERIQNAIKTVKMPTGELSVAIGWDTKVDESQKVSDILRLSENNMYKRKLKETGKARTEIVEEVMNTLYENVDYQKEHSKRVSTVCGKIGEELKLSEKEIDELEILGILHDIGMIGVRKEIQDKVGNLTEEEWIEIKRHPIIGRRIFMSVGKLAELSGVVLAHHERWDGKGYPNGLLGKEIPFYSRILAIADAYESMTGKREYRKSMGKEEAIEEIRKNAGIQFDPYIVEVFLDYLSRNQDEPLL